MNKNEVLEIINKEAPVIMQKAFDDYFKRLREQEVSSWCKADWERACAEGYFDGTKPKDFMTREQGAAVICRVNDKNNLNIVKPKVIVIPSKEG